VHLHDWMKINMAGIAIPFVWNLFCSLLLTLLLVLSYVVPAFTPWFFEHWAALLHLAILAGAIDIGFVYIGMHTLLCVLH
jgi:hypothetical protein